MTIKCQYTIVYTLALYKLLDWLQVAGYRYREGPSTFKSKVISPAAGSTGCSNMFVVQTMRLALDLDRVSYLGHAAAI